MLHVLFLCLISLLSLSLSFKFQSSSRSLRPLVCLAAKKPSKKQPASNKISLKGFGGQSITQTNESQGEKNNYVLHRDAATSDLYHWLENAGVKMNNIALADFDGLRGVIALSDIPKGRSIIEVPYSCALDLGDEGSDPTIPAINFLKFWSNPESRWSTYFDSLPQSGSADLTTTDFFTNDELTMLQWPPVINETAKRTKACENMYENVVKSQLEMGVAFHGRDISLDTFKWAVFIVVSRVLTVIRGDDVTFAKLLIPAIDMFNHCATSPHVLTGRAASGGYLKVLAGEDIKAGTQIFIPYSGGKPRSDRFIQDYGFLDLPGCAKQDMNLMKSSEGIRQVSAGALNETSIEEDENLLNQEGLSARAELAIRFRLALKKYSIGQKRN